MVAPYTTQGPNEIEYFVYEDYQERWVTDGIEVVRTFRTAWSTRGKFVDDMLGVDKWDQTSATFQRSTPEEDLDFDWMNCVDCRLKEPQGVFTETSSGPTWREADAYSRVGEGSDDTDGWAVYECVFKPLPYEVWDDDLITSELDRYVERDEKDGVDSLKVPGQSFTWGATGDTGQPAGTAIPASLNLSPIPEPQNILTGISTFRYMWHRVPGRNVGTLAVLPRKNINACLSCVNNADFDPGYGPVLSGGKWVFPAETLLLNSVEVRRIFSAAGFPLFEVTYELIHRPQGWNKFLKNAGAGVVDFFKVLRAGTANGVFLTADFTKLFRFT